MNTIVLFDHDSTNFYSLTVSGELNRGWLSTPLHISFVNGAYGYPIVERKDLSDRFHTHITHPYFGLYELVGYQL